MASTAWATTVPEHPPTGQAPDAADAASPAPPSDAAEDAENAESDDEEIDVELVRRTLRKYSNQVKFCYDKRLGELPNLAGNIEFEVDIGADGRVTDVTVVKNETGDSKLAECCVEKMERWFFEGWHDGPTEDLYFPFALTPP